MAGRDLSLVLKTTAELGGLTQFKGALRGLNDDMLKTATQVEAASTKLARLEGRAATTGSKLDLLKAEQARRGLRDLEAAADRSGNSLTGMASRGISALGSLGSKIEGLARVGSIAGFSALGAGIAYAVKEAADSQKVYAQLDAVLKSTGGTAGVTAKQVADFALATQKVAPFSDEAVVSVSSLLLTFTNIGKPVFQDATQAVLDMSTALGTDASKSAITLGKALQDPVLGMTALRRVGVAFDAGQQQVIKGLVQTGDSLGAQKLILAELTKEFGGSAEAAGKTFAGQLTIARNALQEVAETIGMAILPTLTELSKEFSAFLADHDEEIKAFAQRLAKDLPDAIDTVKGGIEEGAAGAELLAGGLGKVTGGIDSLKIEIAGLGIAMAFLFPEGALLAGLAAIIISIGVMTQDTDKASTSALNFRAMWLDAIGDVYSGLGDLGAKFAKFALDTSTFGVTKLPGVKQVVGKVFDVPNPVAEGYYKEADRSRTAARLKAETDAQAEAAQKAKHWFGAPVDLFVDKSKLDSTTLGINALTGGMTALKAAEMGVSGASDGMVTAISALYDSNNQLKTGLELAAGAAKAFMDILSPRTLAEINLDRQIAEVEAVMAVYEQSGKTIPADVQKWHDALVANRDVADKVAKAAGANFEELAARLDAAGKNGGEIIKRLVQSLDGLPEQTVVNIATQLNHGDLDEVEKIIDILKNEKVTIPIALEIEQRSKDALREALSGAAIGTSRLPSAYAEGGLTGPGGARMAILHGNEAVLPLNNPKRTFDILHQIGVPGYDGGFGGALVLPPSLQGLVDGSSGGSTGGSTGRGNSALNPGGLNGLAKLDADLKALGISVVEFVAKLELMKERQDAATKSQQDAAQSAFDAQVGLTKLSIVLGEQGITGTAFVAMQGLKALDDAFQKFQGTAEQFIDTLFGHSKGFREDAQGRANRTKKTIYPYHYNERNPDGTPTGKSGGGSTTDPSKIPPDAVPDPPITPERFPGYALGTDYVPRTGVYRLHQGEAVIPADRNRRGESGITVNNWGTVKVTANDTAQFARELGVVLR